MNRNFTLTLTQRISLVFAVLLLACCGASAWLQIRSNDLREKEVVQDLSRGLAAHIARNAALMDADGMKPEGVRRLFGQLMAVNPSVEVYLLDSEGRVKGHDAPSGHLLRERVDLAPIRKFIAGDPLPILGDDPRSADGRKVFSAAALHAGGGDARGAPTGYIYVVLMGEAHDELAARASASSVLRTTLWSMGLVAVLGLIAGLTAFGLITRPLRRLTEQMRAFDTEMEAGVDADARPPALSPSPPAHRSGDDIVALQTAFAQMAGRIDTQWRALTKQDQERRELVANISHDLRTPLTSLHGYLETLSLKADTLGEAERRRYLQIALAQSVKVGSLAQSLFELARLEHGMVQPAWEDFSLVDLVQDVFQKFELSAEARHVRLDASFPPRLPPVTADLAMIERVLTNLIDNAIRHTPAGGSVGVDLAPMEGKVQVTVSDTGPGIPPEQREGLFLRPFNQRGMSGAMGAAGAHRGGGLGLLIVHRMLQLHDSQIRLLEHEARVRGDAPGTAFRFALRAVSVQSATSRQAT